MCDVIHGLLEVSSNAGNGRKGQNGGRGALAADSGHTVRSRFIVQYNIQSHLIKQGILGECCVVRLMQGAHLIEVPIQSHLYKGDAVLSA